MIPSWWWCGHVSEARLMWQLWRGDRQQSADSRQGPGVTPIYCHTNTLQRLNTLCESYEFTLWLSFIINWEFNLHGWHYCRHCNCKLSGSLSLQLSACVLMLSRFMSPPLLWIWSWNCFFSPLSIVDAMPEYRDIRSSAHEQVLEECLPISHHCMSCFHIHYKCRCHIEAMFEDVQNEIGTPKIFTNKYPNFRWK